MKFKFTWTEAGQQLSETVEANSYVHAVWRMGLIHAAGFAVAGKIPADFRFDAESGERIYEPVGEPIQWEPLSEGNGFNPNFSGYTAAYSTGAPEKGWCLYSRRGDGCWEQRTKRVLPPKPGLEPIRLEGQWRWVRMDESEVGA